MEAVISNVYAAYQFCDNPNVSNLLHDLWNELIFEGDSYVDIINEQIQKLTKAALQM